jgi:amino acid adenylation domain-containing protein
MTKERFISNPFSQEKEARIYKTGDLARYLPNGEIEFLGRIDYQVKIRGLRIELGEIEALLAQHPEVKEAVVIAREDIPGDKRLVAYIVSGSTFPSVSDLRDFLKQMSPDYMVPSAFVGLEKLPLTPNGKVDRRALPAPDSASLYSETAFVPPSNPTEEKLAAIWSQILAVEKIGIHDNFFTLGGHSLKATQVISGIRESFGVELPLRELFSAPTIAELAQAIDASIESSGTVEALEIQPRKASAVLTLSFAQERLWFLNQLEGDNATYNIPSAWQLNGALSITALEAAVNEIIRRHEILRTTFKTETGVPTQVIAESLEIKIPLIDLSQIPDTEKFPEIQRWISAEAQHPFNLATDPLVQVKLLRLDALEHILLLTMHHIVSDGWSMGIFWQELSALYKVFSCGKTSPLTELPIQYADYALWQRDWLKGNVLESQLTYWKEQLKDAPPLLELPYENPRPSVQTFRGGNESFQLDLELTEKLQNLSQKSGATLFMTLLAAWSSLLYRYSGRSDILVGTPIANRNRPEIEPLIGFFVNTLVMRTQFKEDRSFADILKIVRQTALDAYAHQDIPFEQLVSELQPNRSLSYNPLFQVMFSLQNASMEPPEFPGVICSDLKRESVVAKFDLWLSMEETEGGLIGEWEYNSDLFDRTTIRRWIGHFQRLLEAIVANPEQPVAQLPLLTESERHQLLVEWNETAKDYPSNKCIHQLFEAQVEKNPDAIAVVFESEQLTYRQLNSRSNQLAHYLQKLGVKPETLVGICVERSLEMVVGLLGILKAGGAYVPLDPNYPSERLTYMLSDAAVPLLLTEEKLVERLKGNAAQAVCLDSQWEELALESEENPINQTKPNNLAYLLYTSGSTGKPKGVSIEHHSPVALLNWAQSVFDIEQLSGVLASTSICFDLSVFELFLPLSCGGQVVLAQNALQLPSLSARDDVTLINTVPSAIAQLVSLNAIPPTAKTIVLAGEPLKKQLVDILYQQDTIEQIFNLYGPSEDSTYSTWFLVEKGTSRSPAIGRPISNTQVYILDQHLQPVPIGVPGELHIGGAGLARGYLHRPELTSQKFIPNPFSNEAGSRLYKTGDLARYLPDGNIEYIGRIDNQVKIRGFRIELGEIEAKLSEHPQVKEVVVIAREDIPGDKRLVAYIVSGSTVTSINPNTVIPVNTGIQDFRDFLKTKLPDYMVPSAFVILEKLPLTPNGKVDRRGLPAPDMASVSETAFVPPSNATEEKLAAIWSQILGIEKIGIHNNFFTLGGHSLKATQVISGIRETFGVELPLRQLFYHPTVAEIAPVIDASVETSGTAEADLIQPRKADAALTLSFAQERLWFLNQLEGESATYNIPSAWQLNGTLSIAALEAAVNEIIRRHESLRTTFTTDNGVPIQVIAANKQITIEAIDLQEISETEPANLVKQWVSSEAQRPFNLATDSLVRVKLLRLSSESHVLMFNIHHIVFDGWSMGVFWQELSALYKAFSGGENSPLAELPIQYADYALWQREWLKGNVLQSQLNYWQEQLKDVTPLELPYDNPRPSVPSFTGKKNSLILSQSLSQSLKTLSQQEGVTIFMSLLAAFKVLLSRYTGSQDIAIGTPVAGRNRPEIEPLIGFFINTVVLRTDLNGNPTFRELLGRVRSVTLGAYEHQEMPFEKLVEELHPERSGSYNPIFQVWFNFLNLEKTELELSDIKVEPMSWEEAPAKFDLNMYVRETQQGIKLDFVYNADLFAAATIEQMSDCFQTLLENVVKNPERSISTLPLLSSTHLARGLDSLQLPYQTPAFIEFAKAEIEQSIPSRFESQVSQYANQIAIKTRRYEWSYQELNQRANQIARAILRSRDNEGTGSDYADLRTADGAYADLRTADGAYADLRTSERIALLFEHDAPMVAGLLGVLKAGKVYVPLDPQYPIARLRYMLADSGSKVIVTNGENLSLAHQLASDKIAIINIEELETKPTAAQVSISPNTVAYILYTSGSTGRPKGVIQTHRNVLHFIRIYTNNLQISSGDRLTLLSSYSFDAAVMDIFGALLNGATLYPIDVKRDGLVNLDRWLIEEKISIYHSTPTLYRYFLDTLLNDKDVTKRLQFPDIRLVVLGGEEVVKRDVELYQRCFSALCIFINGLGPTESTVTLQYFINQQTTIPRNTVPVGYPVDDTEILLLNESGEDNQIYGEIAICSQHIALGYWQQPELTQTVFLPAPKGGDRRIYRTGDLGRLKPDGTIEFLGRKDFQIKVRGFRIELGEIEAALCQDPQVNKAVVVGREAEDGNKQLVAYMVPKEEPLSIEPVKDSLKQKLPEYMIPSFFVTLESLPLTPNGKIDRRSLPAPDMSSASESTFVAPRDDLELRLTQIWQEVLGVKSIGVKDNFFDLGGHSLIAVRMFAAIEKAFGKNLPLATLFQAPTIEQLAHICRDKGWTAPWRSLVTIQPQGSKPPLFFVHGIFGNVIYFRELANYLGSDQPFYGLQAKGLDGKETPYTSLEEMAAHYVQEMRSFQPTGPYFIGGHSFGCIVAFEVAQQLYAQGQEVALLALLDQAVSRHIQVPFSDWLSGHIKNLLSLGYPERVAYVVGRLQAKIKHKIPQQIRQLYKNLGDKETAEHHQRFQTVMEANIQAINRYEPQVYPGKVTLFKAKIGSPRRYALDPLGGWGEFASKGVDVIDVPGDHMTLIQEPYLPVLAEELKACLEKGQGKIS